VGKPSLNAAHPMLRQKAECFFWYRPTRVVPEQRPLNGACCSVGTGGNYKRCSVCTVTRHCITLLRGCSATSATCLTDTRPKIVRARRRPRLTVRRLHTTVARGTLSGRTATLAKVSRMISICIAVRLSFSVCLFRMLSDLTSSAKYQELKRAVDNRER